MGKWSDRPADRVLVCPNVHTVSLVLQICRPVCDVPDGMIFGYNALNATQHIGECESEQLLQQLVSEAQCGTIFSV